MSLTAERLREVMSYDPETGVLTWRKKTGRKGRVVVGRAAGNYDPDGYICVRIDRKNYKAHRLAWLYVYGTWPDNRIDHIDGIKDNNAITNLLREYT